MKTGNQISEYEYKIYKKLYFYQNKIFIACGGLQTRENINERIKFVVNKLYLKCTQNI